jgi:hypothetical protein
VERRREMFKIAVSLVSEPSQTSATLNFVNSETDVVCSAAKTQVRGAHRHIKCALETISPEDSTWTWLLSRMFHLQLLSRSRSCFEVGLTSLYACYIVDNSQDNFSNSYFELALEDWSEPLGDLIILCGTSRLRSGSSGNI